MQSEDHSFMSLPPQDPSFITLTQLDATLRPMLDTSSMASSMIGEYIGIESCVDLVKNHEDKSKHIGGLCKRDHRRGMEKVMKKEFPPPIPLLARTENLPSHMPWVLKRYYTSDGRLILREEKVRHHEYFRAHRSNGRLTLQLVLLDDDISPPSFVNTEGDYEPQEVDEECMVESNDMQKNDCSAVGDDNDDDDEDDTDDGVGVVEDGFDYLEEQRVPSSMETGIAGNRTPPIKCLDYNSVNGTSNYIFGVPLPPMRPVQS